MLACSKGAAGQRGQPVRGSLDQITGPLRANVLRRCSWGRGGVAASWAPCGASCGMQCCASGMQWMWCSPRAVRASVLASRSHGRAQSMRNGPAVGRWGRPGCLVGCSWRPAEQLLVDVS